MVLAEAGAHACTIACLGHVQAPLFPGQRERVAPPSASGSSVLNSQGSDRCCLLPGGPTSDTGLRRPCREGSQPPLERERENQVCVCRTECRAFLQSIQTLNPGSDYVNIMSDEEGRVEWDLGVVFLCILKPLSGETQWEAKYPPSRGKSQRHVRSLMDARVERIHGDESIEEQCSDPGMIMCFAWFLMLLPSFVKPGNESCWPERDQKKH